MALIISQSGTVISPTDFYIEIESITDRDGNNIDLSTMPFYFEFFADTVYAKIQSNKSVTADEVYIVSYDGTDRINNFYEDGVLRFKFENYPITSGKVYYKQVESYANTDFDDNSEDIVTILKTNITLKNVGSNTITSTNVISGYITLGALRGEQGDDYVLTDQDKQDIADLVDVTGGGSITIDEVPTEGSDNAVSSGGVYEALQNIDAETVTTSGDITSGKRVVAEGDIKTNDGNVFTSDGNIYTSNGDIYSTEGDIYTVDGDFVAREGSYYKGSGDYKTEVAYIDELPTKTSDLANDSEFTTLAKVLEWVYSKGETLTTTEIKTLIATVQGELDTLVGGDASTAIDSYNEIIAFLASFTDSDDLASVLLALKNEIVALIPSLDGYLTTAIANDTFVSLNGYVAYSSTEKEKLAGIEEGADVTPTLGAVATSNSYNDLDDKPTIPSIDGLATEEYVAEKVAIEIEDGMSKIEQYYEVEDALDEALGEELDLTIEGKAQRISEIADEIKASLAEKNVSVSSSAALSTIPSGIDGIPQTVIETSSETSSEGDVSVYGEGDIKVRFYDHMGLFLIYYLNEGDSIDSSQIQYRTYDRLTFDGWNVSDESFENITQDLDVGALYTVDSGRTEFDITIEAESGVMVGFPVGTVTTTGTYIKVYWGDGQTTTGINGDYLAPENKISQGDWTIEIESDGAITLSGSTTTFLMGDRGTAQYIRECRAGNVAAISSYAFYYNGIQRVVLPRGVGSIGSYAFQYSQLRGVIFPPSVLTISDYSFQYNYNLEFVVFSSETEGTGSYAFAYCYGLTSVVFSSSMTTTGSYALHHCHGLTSVVFGSSMTATGSYAFTLSPLQFIDLRARTALTALSTAPTAWSDNIEIWVATQEMYDIFTVATNWVAFADKFVIKPLNE